LFMVAMLDHMRSRGFIACVAGVWQLSVPLDEIELGVPDSLRRLIEAQIGLDWVRAVNYLQLAADTAAGPAVSRRHAVHRGAHLAGACLRDKRARRRQAR
jgi:hypothetical protein